MKRLKRYTKESDIIQAIDDCHVRFADLMKKADDLDSLAATEIQISTQLQQVADDESLARRKRQEANSKLDTCKTQAREYKIKASRTRRRATKLIDVRAKDLGEALAKFRTDVMASIVGDDRGVVAVFR